MLNHSRQREKLTILISLAVFSLSCMSAARASSLMTEVVPLDWRVRVDRPAPSLAAWEATTGFPSH